MFKLRLLSVLLISLLSLNTNAKSCKSLLKKINNSDASTLLGPLEITNLIKDINFNKSTDTGVLNPHHYTHLTAYTNKNKDLLSDINFPVKELSDNDRIVETDFGYAVLDKDDLKAWAGLESTIAQPYKAKEFINKIANEKTYFPKGISKNAARWLKWSASAEVKSTDRAYRKLDIDEESEYSFEIFGEILKQQHKELKKLVDRKGSFIFPFGRDTSDPIDSIAIYDAQVILEVLTRHFLLSNFYVKDSGKYVKLSALLDRDTLLLLSRFPELMPIAPIFKGGHLKVDYMEATIGRNDFYDLVDKKLPTRIIKDHKFNSFFTATIDENKMFSDDGITEVDAFFYVAFHDTTKASKELSKKTIDKAFSDEVLKMNEFLKLRTSQFNTITGHNLPISTVVIDHGLGPLKRAYEVTFGEHDIPTHILAAFYVFAGLK